jgi:uncharacterized protein (TIGR02466 family)
MEPKMAFKRAADRFQHTDVLRMFPSFVWKAELARDIYEPMNAALLASLRAIGAPLDGLAHGQSWQSDHNLHQFAMFRELAECIITGAHYALAYLKISPKIAWGGIVLTGCWANVNAPGAAHSQHSHPNNFLSGVYYLKTQPGADTIDFHDPRSQTGIIRPPVTELTAENTDQVVVMVKEGMLLIFPAWLPHSVDPNRSEEIRISLSFNLMFTEYAETRSPPLWEPGART